GGMEHQTMTTQGWFEDGLTAHELGHQWFGDNVTCATWADIWLNEGFASYTEYLMEAQFNPGNEAQLMQNVHNNVMSSPGGSVWVEDSLNTNRIFSGRLTYDKGNAIVHTLRFLIDDDAIFFNILQTYQNQFADSTATVSDFKVIAENLSGLDLTNFFNEWYYGQGYPTYSVKYAGTGIETVLQVIQTSSSPTHTAFFTNDLEIKLIAQNGSINTVRLPINGPVSNHLVPFAHTVSTIQVDPNNWIINETGTIEEALSILEIESQTSAQTIVFPNPAENLLWIVMDEIGDAKLYNVSGQLVWEKKECIGQQKIDISEFPAGSYVFTANGYTKHISIK
ncbi:MAG: M1 family aminopeptidase, partial [Putridiphycobacter sp.]|nr:M1 family aminopeptidase [Putridiphycobacter sp.]